MWRGIRDGGHANRQTDSRWDPGGSAKPVNKRNGNQGWWPWNYAHCKKRTCGFLRLHPNSKKKKKHPLQCDDQSGLAGDHCGLMYGRIIFYLSCLTRMAWTWAIAAWRGVAFWIFKREIESKTFILSKDYGAEGEARAPWLVEQPPRAEKYQGCRATSD